MFAKQRRVINILQYIQLFIIMKAIILAGGYATRLYPITLNLPKSLINIAWKPIINFLMEKIMREKNISEIFVVTNGKFYNDFVEWKKIYWFDTVKVINNGTKSNEERLWPIGDLDFLLKNNTTTEDLLILWGDNLFDDDIDSIIQSFHTYGNTIALYDVQDLELAKNFWIVELDKDKSLTSFIEKPNNPSSTLISTMIYVIKNENIQYISQLLEEWKKNNRGEIKAWELIAYILKYEKIRWHVLQNKWFDIGTMEQLKEAEKWIYLKNT